MNFLLKCTTAVFCLIVVGLETLAFRSDFQGAGRAINCPMKHCSDQCEIVRGADGCPRCDCSESVLCERPRGCPKSCLQLTDNQCFKCKCPESEVARCFLPTKRGVCRADIVRYYYDSSMQQCQSFRYGGCEGNDNNFLTMAECIYACQNKIMYS